MTEQTDIITARGDKSQVLHYRNPFFFCIADKSFYTPERTINVTDHWHDEIEYIYVVEGRMHFTVNGEKFILEAGNGICVNSKRIHANRSPKDEYCVFYYALVHPSNLCVTSYIEQKYVAPIIGSDSFDYFLLKKGDWTEPIMNDLKEIFEEEYNEGRELEIIELSFRNLRRMYVHLKPNSSYSTESGRYVDTYKDMLTYINEHFSEKISLEEIAIAGNVGKTLCTKIFKKFSGRTPGDYLIHYRITESMRLLDENKLTVTEIAYNTGFNSASHFTKTFRELLGVTPNKYRDTLYAQK